MHHRLLTNHPNIMLPTSTRTPLEHQTEKEISKVKSGQYVLGENTDRTCRKLIGGQRPGCRNAHFSFIAHLQRVCPFYSGLKRSGLHWLELKGQCSMSRLYLPQARLAHPETFLLSLHRNAHAPFWTCGPALSLPAGPSPPAPTSHRAILFQCS